MRDFLDQRQVVEFAEVAHFRDPGKAADMPKLDDRWNLGLWLGKSVASDEQYVGTSAGFRRCWSIWRRPEKRRWDRKMLTEMNGEPWNPTAHHRDHCGTSNQARRNERCFGRAKVHSPECRARFQDIVDNEAAQTAAVSVSEPHVEIKNRQRVAPRPVRAEDRCRLRADPRRRMPARKLQRARQDSRRVLWFGRWRLRTTRVQNVRG